MSLTTTYLVARALEGVRSAPVPHSDSGGSHSGPFFVFGIVFIILVGGFVAFRALRNRD